MLGLAAVVFGVCAAEVECDGSPRSTGRLAVEDVLVLSRRGVSARTHCDVSVADAAKSEVVYGY